eukprot:TRINITY_DN2495_c0_g1_i5.p1 TRINITY_DN2495_c0_g1~~TRINITY_DN2495_c0_g1_i5.p1  ORF type:complete len:393 (+),score=48.52 TRINITY_DN2495_c0_g1_i5:92-1180(+)
MMSLATLIFMMLSIQQIGALVNTTAVNDSSTLFFDDDWFEVENEDGYGFVRDVNLDNTSQLILTDDDAYEVEQEFENFRQSLFDNITSVNSSSIFWHDDDDVFVVERDQETFEQEALNDTVNPTVRRLLVQPTNLVLNLTAPSPSPVPDTKDPNVSSTPWFDDDAFEIEREFEEFVGDFINLGNTSQQILFDDDAYEVEQELENQGQNFFNNLTSPNISSTFWFDDDASEMERDQESFEQIESNVTVNSTSRRLLLQPSNLVFNFVAPNTSPTPLSSFYNYITQNGSSAFWFDDDAFEAEREFEGFYRNPANLGNTSQRVFFDDDAYEREYEGYGQRPYYNLTSLNMSTGFWFGDGAFERYD